MFELCIMATGPLRQPLTFARDKFFLNRDFEPDIESFKALWENIFPLNRIANRNLHFQPEIF